MRRILSAEYDQTLLLAPSVEEWIGPRHPARFIREFVAAVDLCELGLDTLEREEGGVGKRGNCKLKIAKCKNQIELQPVLGSCLYLQPATSN